ncbi:hypothetical protein [Nitrosopumilus sp.]|uniref:hypothetical protein n=1 Tax=Nitrosopumilus sp. TaxID=2024843 RepID=UPI003B5BF0DC
MMSSNSEKNNKQKKDDKDISLCEIHKDTTSEIVKKLESKIPSFAQNYSDLYDAYLHMADDVHSAFCMAEKEFIDKMNIESETIRDMKKHYDKTGEQIKNNIDAAGNIFDAYVKMKISMLESFDKYMHVWMESYGNMLSEYMKQLKSN